jgi:hypothetical protein
LNGHQPETTSSFNLLPSGASAGAIPTGIAFLDISAAMVEELNKNWQ